MVMDIDHHIIMFESNVANISTFFASDRPLSYKRAT